MRKLIRLGAALLLAASGLVATATTSSAEETVVECDDEQGDADGDIDNDGVSVTSLPEPFPDELHVVGDEDVCAELVRTLVFVGTADITNGVNFAGTGAASTAGVSGGGSFTFTGADVSQPLGCVMVNWEDPDNSSTVGHPLVTDCNFLETTGTYGPAGTGEATPVVHEAGEGIEGGTPGYTGLDFAPDDEASCFDSDGQGTAGFQSFGLDGSSELWSSSYTWENGLTNLRGEIWDDTDADGVQDSTERAFFFDAKINAQANPFAGPAEDRTAAGCLQKTIQAPTAGEFPGATVGLNSVLVAGTATWNSSVPVVLGDDPDKS